MLIVVGLVLILALTVATGYFVAQEFSYVAVDRNRLQGLADAGDSAAARALKVTQRLSFVLSGAQVGITVTALLAGYVAEPYLGKGLENLLGTTGLPEGVSLVRLGGPGVAVGNGHPDGLRRAGPEEPGDRPGRGDRAAAVPLDADLPGRVPGR